MSNSDSQPTIIIGAARSGTNMLRDILTSLPDMATWPCDEINYIWRHGNTHYPTDEFPSGLATLSVKHFIRKRFEWAANRYGTHHVVEKTCANSLRVGFVDQIFPEAKYVFLIRDGRDVMPSAMKRWSAGLDLNYILAKARFVPVADIPYYAIRYLGNRIYQILSQESRQAFWGPRFDGMEAMLQEHSLAEVCATQWARSVTAATRAFGSIDERRVFTLKYETFVSNPTDELDRILRFLSIDAPERAVEAAVKDVSTRSVGKWREELDEMTLSKIMPIVADTLKANGYE